MKTDCGEQKDSVIILEFVCAESGELNVLVSMSSAEDLNFEDLGDLREEM